LNVGDVAYIVDGAVVVEAISVPITSLIANANVAESVVNAAVVAHMVAPKSVMVAVPAAGKTPVSGRPQ
jgi:hypothetical protein